MNKAIFLAFVSLLINGCSTTGMTTASGVANVVGAGTAELTGVSFFHDRRDTKSIVLDEKIEDDAMINLNLNSYIRTNSHFNVTSYNGIVLITGETPVEAVLSEITTFVQKLSDVRAVQNQMQLDYPTSFPSRANDSFITAKVKTALASDYRLPGFDTTRIKVVTENGRVFLMGLVYKKEGDIAAEITSQQEGVREVVKVFEYI